MLISLIICMMPHIPKCYMESCFSYKKTSSVVCRASCSVALILVLLIDINNGKINASEQDCSYVNYKELWKGYSLNSMDLGSKIKYGRVRNARQKANEVC